MRIHENTTGKTCPDLITKDSRGIKIEPGLTIAFNRSGDIVKGKIIDVKTSWKEAGSMAYPRWYCRFLLTAEGEDGKISKLKNPNSFIII